MFKRAFLIMLAAVLLSGCAGYKVSVLGVDVKALHSMEASDCGEVALGVVASVATHVAGHFIAAEIFDVDIHLEGLNEVVDYSTRPSQNSLQWMARGGFLFQLAVNTALVELAPDSYFTKGFTGFTTIELLTYHQRHPNSGDFALLTRNEADGDMEYNLFLTWAAYNALRLSITEAE
jgi:hypothetical protein